jgi:type I restriction enzyme S subunit
VNQVERLIFQLCPSGVPVHSLGSLLTANRGGGTPSTAIPEYWDGEIPWTSIGDMNTPGMFIETTRRWITEAGLRNSSTTLVKAGDVLVAVKISPGAMKIASRDIAINQDIRGLTLDSRVNPAFLVYFFRTFSIVGDGTIVKGITNATLEKVKVPLPPLEVQNEIVRILDTFTELGAELASELEARKTQFEYIRTELIRDCIEKYPSAPIGSMISHLRTGLNPRQNFVLNPPGAKCSYITVRELDGFGIRTTDKTDKVDEHGFAAIQNRSKLQAGDVLFSATGTIGRTALVENTPSDWGIKEGVYAITTDSAKLHPRFLIYLFGHSTIYDEIIARSEGSTVRSISMASLKALMIPAPPLAVQKSIVDKLDVTYELTFGLLPKEIAARKQQYEYYRGKLLTFKELENA